MVRPGECCPKCKRKRMRTVRSVQAGESMQLRYVKCDECGHCDKTMIPSEYVSRRSFLSKETTPEVKR